MIRPAMLALVVSGVVAGTYAVQHRLGRSPDDMANAPSLAPPKKPIPASFFGLTVLDYAKLTPSMPFGTTRSWDAGPGLDWADANPAPGVFRFAALDAFLAFNQAHGSDGIYTFGRTPRWASAKPDDSASPYGPGQCAPPANLRDWDAYVSAIATHAAGRIRYWELWNEPNEPGYCGDVAALVPMAQHAHRILKQIDPNAVVLTPSVDKVSGPAWLDAFLSSGGAGTVDAIAFHGYWSARPEDLLGAVASIRQVAAANGLARLPLWDTEVSWAYTSDMPLPPLPEQAAFLAKSYLLHWWMGVDRTVWYAYDAGSPWGTLAPGGMETPTAFAYRQTYRWMVGATMPSPCRRTDDRVWSCPLARPGGYAALAVWKSDGSLRFRVPKQFTQYQDLGGASHPVVNGTVVVNNLPILLQTGPLPQP